MCDDQSHHWIERPTSEADELDLQCEHCGVLGYTCPECDGWGCIYGDGDDGRDIEAECEVCKGGRGIAVARTDAPPL